MQGGAGASHPANYSADVFASHCKHFLPVVYMVAGAGCDMVSWPGDTFKMHPGFETRHPADWQPGQCLQRCSSWVCRTALVARLERR